MNSGFVINQVNVIAEKGQIHEVICAAEIVNPFSNFVPFVINIINDGPLLENFVFCTFRNAIEKSHFFVHKLILFL